MVGVAVCLGWQPRAAKFVAIPLLLLAVAAMVQTAPQSLGMDGFCQRARDSDGRDCAGIGDDLPLFGVRPFAGDPSNCFGCWRSWELCWLCAASCISDGRGCMRYRCGNIRSWNGKRFGTSAIWRWFGRRYGSRRPSLVGRLPTPVLRIGAVLMICSYNLTNGLAREYASSEVPLDRVTADIYRSQPHSETRTYFEMHELFDDTMYRPLALYNACMAARLEPTPAEFRVGSSWPFEYGEAAITVQKPVHLQLVDFDGKDSRRSGAESGNFPGDCVGSQPNGFMVVARRGGGEGWFDRAVGDDIG